MEARATRRRLSLTNQIHISRITALLVSRRAKKNEVSTSLDSCGSNHHGTSLTHFSSLADAGRPEEFGLGFGRM